MNIDWEVVRGVAVTVIPAGVAVLGYLSGPGALRSRLRHDVEMLEKLPTDSAAHRTLLQHVESQIKLITELDTNASRDWQGAIISAVLVLILGGFGLFLDGLDGWGWRIAAGVVWFVAIVGLASMFEDLQRVPRDDKGKKLSQASSTST